MKTNIPADVTGTIWKIETTVGAKVAADDTLVLIESMKMEIPVVAPRAGTVIEIKLAEGETVAEGQVVVVLE